MAQQIQPRIFDPKGAADYVSFSPSFINNTRQDDKKRLKEGDPIIGPVWVKIGRNVRYFKEDLDLWLDAIYSGKHPHWQDDFKCDTSGLKNQSAA